MLNIYVLMYYDNFGGVIVKGSEDMATKGIDNFDYPTVI